MVFRELGYPSPNALRQWYNEYMQTGTLHSKANRRDVYSQEQIDAAVAYYNEHGGSLIATCRALGYPDRNTMSQWVRAAYPDGGKPPVRRCKSDRELVRYTPEQKQAAVEAWMSGTPDYKIAAQYGVCKATVYNWKKELLGKVSVRMKKQENTASFEALSDNKEELEAEVKSLQAEIHRLFVKALGQAVRVQRVQEKAPVALCPQRCNHAGGKKLWPTGGTLVDQV